nr:acyl-CoA-binding domain-containing protein 4 [Tanacetum cinerariifolium]
EADMGTDSGSWHSAVDSDQWVALPVAGRRPLARYKHAAVVVDDKLYIVGGSRNGRYLSDVQAFDLKNLSWSSIKLSTKSDAENDRDITQTENLPAIAGHSMVKWGSKLLFLGGHSKDASDNVTVYYIDLESHLFGVMGATGKVPVARGGQSVSLTMTWNVADTIQTPPAPRFDHTAAVHAERYLQIFGGCTHSIFFNDLHVLDLETLEWSQPQIQGDLVSPRAGHAGVAIDENWFIVGGGDNKNGSSETLVMDMPKLVISVLTNVKERDPLASEGLSVSSAFINGELFLVAFGGYNGKYSNEVFVMRPLLKDSKNSKIFQSPAAAAAAASVTAAYALAKSESFDFTSIGSKP